MIAGGLRLLALAVIVAGAGWLIMKDDNAPTLESLAVGDERDDYRRVTGRVTPPEAAELSERFVQATGMLREQVLQRLSEFKAQWRVPAPRVSLHTSGVQGNAVAFAEQLRGWFEQNNLLAVEAMTGESDGSDAGGNDVAGTDGGASADTGMNGSSVNESAQNLVEGELPGPPAPGLVIRSRSRDIAIARDLALALAPAIGGELYLLPDERVDPQHLVVTLVGAPRFSEDGVAYFQAQ